METIDEQISDLLHKTMTSRQRVCLELACDNIREALYDRHDAQAMINSACRAIRRIESLLHDSREARLQITELQREDAKA